MSKKQIKLTQDSIRRMISEAIKSYSFNGEGFNDEPDDKFDAHGNPKYPGGIFSTDSEEGEAFKERAKKYDKPEDNELIWNQREGKLKDAEDNVTGAKWADTYDSLWDTGEKLDKMARDEFGDEEEEGQRYDKPFGDLDDTENQWADEPGYEEEDEDDNIAGLNEGKITLTEEGLRNFISYSVAKLLKEGYRPIYRSLGNGDYDYDGDEWDGRPDSNGSTEIELSNESLIQALSEVAGVEFDDHYKQEFASQYGQEPDEDDFIDDMMRKIGFETVVKVDLDFDVDNDPGDYWTPGITSTSLNSWEIDSSDEGFAQASDMGKKIMKAAAEYEIEGNEDELYDRLNEEVNLGPTVHYDGTKHFEPENPYKGMTWDEYCEAKRKEHEEEERKAKEEGPTKRNLGITVHYDGRKPSERTPEEIERDEHMFDDQYWVDKMKLSKDDLQEMVRRAVKGVVNKLK